MLWFQTPVPECTVVNLPVLKLPVNVFDSRCFFCSYCSVPLLDPSPFPSFFLCMLPSVIWRRWSVWFSLLQAFLLFSVPLPRSASSWLYSSCERWAWLYFPESSQCSVFIFLFLFYWLVSCRFSSPSAWGGKSTAAKTTALLLFILLYFISLLLLYSTFVFFLARSSYLLHPG